MPFYTLDIPLGYFEHAIDWLTDRETVFDDWIGLTGISMGTAPAFLAAKSFEGPATVVTLSGGPLFIPANDDDPVRFSRNGEPMVTNEEVENRGGKALGIEIEAIDGPVLVLTGQDDELVGSAHEGEYSNRRLSHHDHSHPYSHVTYEDTGHVFDTPYTSYAEIDSSFSLGGIPVGNARAAADAWIRMLDYFEYGRRQRINKAR